MVDLNDFLPDDRILLTTFLSFCFGFLLKTSDQTSYDFGIAEFIDVEFFWFHSTARPAYQRKNWRRFYTNRPKSFRFFLFIRKRIWIFQTIRKLSVLRMSVLGNFFSKWRRTKNQLFHCSHSSTYKTVDNFMYGKICMFSVQREKMNYTHRERIRIYFSSFTKCRRVRECYLFICCFSNIFMYCHRRIFFNNFFLYFPVFFFINYTADIEWRRTFHKIISFIVYKIHWIEFFSVVFAFWSFSHQARKKILKCSVCVSVRNILLRYVSYTLLFDDESCLLACSVHICINERREKNFIVRYMYATCTRKTREKTLCNNPHFFDENYENSAFEQFSITLNSQFT